MTATLALSTHVVDYSAFWADAINRGLWCTACREKFCGYRWGADGMVISCDCPCVCHRKAPDRDSDGHKLKAA